MKRNSQGQRLVRYACRDFQTVIATINEVGYVFDNEGILFDYDIVLSQYWIYVQFRMI